jgi:hypothetical protein
MNIAIFADLHGRLLLCFKICLRWQQETGQKLDLILQAGDMGIFPDSRNLDRSTLLHAKHDPTELGFSQYFVKHDPQVEAILNQLDCNLVCVRGNHEDHQWLDKLEQQASTPIFPVDIYKLVYCLKSGELYNFHKANQSLRILGIGRIGQSERSPGSSQPIYIQPYEAKRIFNYKRSTQIDILLTHDRATTDLREVDPASHLKGGMSEIREALNYYQPNYHFFGHVGGPLLHYTDANKVTQVAKLEDFCWTQNTRQQLRPDSMAILRWSSPQAHSLEIVNTAWLQEYAAYNWQYL